MWIVHLALRRPYTFAIFSILVLILGAVACVVMPMVTSSQLGLIQSEGLVRQQEVILKTQLARKGTADPLLGELPVVPTDPIIVPPSDDLPPVDSLVAQAVAIRPDLAQASLQVQGGEVALKASQNAARPEIDLVANFQTRGSTEIPFTTAGTPGTGAITAPTDLGVAGAANLPHLSGRAAVQSSVEESCRPGGRRSGPVAAEAVGSPYTDTGQPGQRRRRKLADCIANRQDGS